jgi:hypothetical protein
MWLCGKRFIQKDVIRYFRSIFYSRLPFSLLYIRTRKGVKIMATPKWKNFSEQELREIVSKCTSFP